MEESGEEEGKSPAAWTPPPHPSLPSSSRVHPYSPEASLEREELRTPREVEPKEKRSPVWKPTGPWTSRNSQAGPPELSGALDCGSHTGHSSHTPTLWKTLRPQRSCQHPGKEGGGGDATPTCLCGAEGTSGLGEGGDGPVCPRPCLSSWRHSHHLFLCSRLLPRGKRRKSQREGKGEKPSC